MYHVLHLVTTHYISLEEHRRKEKESEIDTSRNFLPNGLNQENKNLSEEPFRCFLSFVI